MKNLRENFLTEFYSGIKPEKIVYSKRTGVVYHQDMLLHKSDPDDNLCKNHVENPHRLSTILQHMEKRECFKDCQIINEFEEIDWSIVQDIHGEDYVDYLKNLWPENHKNFRMRYNDTYYNQFTLRSARLAAEATRLSSEKIIQNEWRNAFSIVRPPGHHACAQENKIQGFCFINNVAVAAQYLSKNHGVKKIAILDWDVHHGDSTQKLFYDRNDVLYISIHRHDNGKFYPYISGDVNNVGEGIGEGYNLNFPINTIKGQYVGDEEYIFVFYSLILPIMKKYDPEFIFISCGFDCLNRDPLGGFRVSKDSLSLMLFQIQNYITPRINVVLEGGYNTKEIPWACESILRVLKGDHFPNEITEKKLTFYFFRHHLVIQKLFVQNYDDNFNVWKKFWEETLMRQKHVEYRNEILKVTQNSINFVGGHYMSLKIVGNEFHKILNEKELIFYRDYYPTLSDKLKQYIPKLLRLYQDDQKNNWLVSENITQPGKKLNQMDLKLADKDKTKYQSVPLWKKYQIAVTGYKIVNTENQILEKRQKIYLYTRIDDIFDIFLKFLRSPTNTKSDVIKYVQYLIEQLDIIGEIVSKNQYSLSQVSMLILFDVENNEVQLKMIDFPYFLQNQKRTIVKKSISGFKYFLNDFKEYIQTPYRYCQLIQTNFIFKLFTCKLSKVYRVCLFVDLSLS